MKKSWIIIIVIIIIAIGIITFAMYMIDMERMEHYYPVVFSTWGRDYKPGMNNYFKDNKENENEIINEDLSINDMKNSAKDITEEFDTFEARIKIINEYKGKYSILVDGLETNEINYRSEYWCSIGETTNLLDRDNNKIEITDLKENQIVSITFTGGMKESYPAQIGDVLKVQVAD